MKNTQRRLRLALALLGWPGTLLASLAVPASEQDVARQIVLVNVVDRQGVQIGDLTAVNFRGEIRGKPVTIVPAKPDKTGRRVAIVVDTSGSQEGVPVWRAVEELVDRLVPGNRVVILTMDTALQKHSDLTGDRQALEAAIRAASAVKRSGPTSVYDGAMQASQGFSSPQLGDAVCLMTDGVDSSSRLDSKAVIAAVARRGVRVFVVRTSKGSSAGVPYSAATARPEQSGRSPAEWNRLANSYALEWTTAIARATGGSCFTPAQLDKERAAGTLSSMITEGYRLEVELPVTADTGGEWKLQVVGADGKKLSNARVIYPETMPSRPSER